MCLGWRLRERVEGSQLNGRILNMFASQSEYERAQAEIRDLENRLQRIQQDQSIASKGFTKAGIRKMISRIHEELAVYDGRSELRQ